MNRARNWIILVVASAAAGYVALQGGIHPAATPTTIPIAITEAPTYEGCYYVWATHDAPEISARVDAIVKSFDAAASASATFYGEDCVYSDGHSTFGTMETDFVVRRPATDLTNEETFGNWMKQVADELLKLPQNSIQGQFGFVEFWFVRSDTEQLIVRLPLSKYQSEARAKTGSELFKYFHSSP